jgi:pentatricopeptide repeat protein
MVSPIIHSFSTQGGEVDIARSIFDSYILPLPSSRQTESIGNQNSLFTEQVKPITRHFNVLIEGYRGLHEKQAKIKSASKSSENHWTPLQHANILFDNMVSSGVKPDAYTLTSMLGLQKKSSTITNLWQRAVSELDIPMTAPVYHSLMSAYGRVNDPSSACYVFDCMIKARSLNKTLNSWNVMLSALSKTCKKEAAKPINCLASSASSVVVDGKKISTEDMLLPGGQTLIELVDGRTTIDAASSILDVMKISSKTSAYSNLILRPNSQSYCLVAALISQGDSADGETAIDLFHDAMESNIPADGRFINAIIRCFGDDIDGAINAWRNRFRASVVAFENRERPKYGQPKKGKNLIASYHGLVHVAGKAGRPDIALRIAYAMKKEGYEPHECTLNSYKTGSIGNKFEKTIRLNEQYENLLTIECTKYNKLDKRRSTEKRVRIII